MIQVKSREIKYMISTTNNNSYLSTQIMENIKLNYDNICTIFRTCYPFVKDGIYSLNDPEISDMNLNESISLGDNYDSDEI